MRDRSSLRRTAPSKASVSSCSFRRFFCLLAAALPVLCLSVPPASATGAEHDAGADAPAAAQDQHTCPEAGMPPIRLKNFREALQDNEQAIIVAIGSSSTQGWMSSDIAASYPALLQKELSGALPHAHIAVLNRGIGGQDVTEEMPRLQSDALDVHPQVVIWQVGANGAMRNIDPEVFRKMVTAGVTRMQKASIDVVLMDNQRSPHLLAAKEAPLLDRTMAAIARETGAALFARGKLMDAWQQEGFPYEDFIAPDGLHHNDFGYRCLAHALAQSILTGLSQAGSGRPPEVRLPHPAIMPQDNRTGSAAPPPHEEPPDDEGS